MCLQTYAADFDKWREQRHVIYGTANHLEISQSVMHAACFCGFFLFSGGRQLRSESMSVWLRTHVRTHCLKNVVICCPDHLQMCILDLNASWKVLTPRAVHVWSDHSGKTLTPLTFLMFLTQDEGPFLLLWFPPWDNYDIWHLVCMTPLKTVFSVIFVFNRKSSRLRIWCMQFR